MTDPQSIFRDIIPTDRTRVLIVDNHELVRRGLAALVNAEADMESCGEVAVGDNALETVQAARPAVVLMDLSLAHGAGLQLIQRIRQFDASIRIVALVLREHPQLVERISNAGAAPLVLQANLANRVLEAIRRVQTDAAAVRTPVTGGAGRCRMPAPTDRTLDAEERQIIELIGAGTATREIAVRLGVSVAMVDDHRRRIRRKLNCPTATQLVQFCVRWVQQKRGESARR